MTLNRADKLILAAAGHSQAGLQRAVNEDHLATPEGADPELLARLGHLYVVADGMGGHVAGAQASALAVSTVMEAYYGHPSPDPGQALTEAIRQANAALHRQAQYPETAGMGSTVVAALVQGRDLYIAHVGDSRAYLIRGQGIKQITRDHTWVAEQVRDGLLSEEEARRHSYRNVITRALGSGPEVEVDLSREKLRPGDAVLLCSDGLTDEVQDEEIRQIVAGNDPQEAATELVELASQRGGSDDVTALVIGVRRVPRLALADLFRSSKLAPIVGGVAIAAVILIALYWVLALRGSIAPTEVASPSPAAVAVVSTQTPVASVASATPTATSSPSATPPAVAVPVELTNTPTSTPTPTDTPIPTSTPTPPCEELIHNGGFETAGDWINWSREETVPRPPDYSRDVVRSGDWAMRLGITSESDYRSYSSVKQTVTIPEDAVSAVLSFWYYPICQDDYPYDWQEAIIYDATLTHKLNWALWQDCSNSQSWTHQTFDLMSYKGQTIIVYFYVSNNGAGGLKTAMYLDDVSIEVRR